jgi:hypothetical protein
LVRFRYFYRIRPVRVQKPIFVSSCHIHIIVSISGPIARQDAERHDYPACCGSSTFAGVDRCLLVGDTLVHHSRAGYIEMERLNSNCYSSLEHCQTLGPGIGDGKVSPESIRVYSTNGSSGAICLLGSQFLPWSRESNKQAVTQTNLPRLRNVQNRPGPGTRAY